MSLLRTHGRRHGRVCTRMSSGLGDEREQEGELTGKRRPRERREEEDGELQAKPPLVARGRVAACVGEQAAGGGGVQVIGGDEVKPRDMLTRPKTTKGSGAKAQTVL